MIEQGQVPFPAPGASRTLAQREAAVLEGEHVAVLREQAADLREQDAGTLESALHALDQATQAKAELGALSAALLREANERLVVATIRAQTMAEAAQGATAQMAYMAQHDVLTGLPNRALLTDRLAQAVSMAQRHGKRVALVYLDLDQFKHINDSLGHAVGDQLLQSAARRLQKLVRHSDTVCRQGGDEFVVLLAEVEAVCDAVLTAAKLVQAMAEPHQVGAHNLHVTASIGVSVYPDNSPDADALVRNADIAMYHAKRRGRNNYQLFAQEMNVRAVARQAVEMALRKGLDEHRFVLHYQPKVSFESGAVTGAEALMRLRQANQPLLYPTEFVQVAEDSGLILPIGQWVLREACRQTQAWLQDDLDIGSIAVNVSTVEFHHKDFLAGVRSILGDTGLEPRYLELELTETGLMQDTQQTAATLQALKQLGVQIAIDDFGTGYSSLSYLRRFPIDTLKIDQSFVQDIKGDAEEAILVGAIIAMGKSLKLRVVAEGVETQHQLDYLQSQRCTAGQGYYLGRPVDAREFVGSLAAGRP